MLGESEAVTLELGDVIDGHRQAEAVRLVEIRCRPALGQTSLVEAVRRKEEWAWRRLVDTYHPGLLRYLHRHGDEAEDVALEAWESLYRSRIPEGMDEEGLRHWLFAMAYRRSADRVRRARRSARQACHVAEVVDLPIVSTEDSVLAAPEWQGLFRLVDRLPSTQSQVVRLRFLADLDATEIADLLGLKPDNVRQLLHRALKRLARDI